MKEVARRQTISRTRNKGVLIKLILSCSIMPSLMGCQKDADDYPLPLRLEGIWVNENYQADTLQGIKKEIDYNVFEYVYTIQQLSSPSLRELYFNFTAPQDEWMVGFIYEPILVSPGGDTLNPVPVRFTCWLFIKFSRENRGKPSFTVHYSSSRNCTLIVNDTSTIECRKCGGISWQIEELSRDLSKNPGEGTLRLRNLSTGDVYTFSYKVVE